MIAPTAILREAPCCEVRSRRQPNGKPSQHHPTAGALVLVTILPVLAFSAFMIVRYAQVQRIQYQQQLQATAHATSLAIDAELSRNSRSSRRSATPVS